VSKLLGNVLIFLAFHVETQLHFTQCLGTCIATQLEMDMSAKYVSFDQFRRQYEYIGSIVACRSSMICQFMTRSHARVLGFEWLIMHKSNTFFLKNTRRGHIVTHALRTYLIPGAAPHLGQSGVHFRLCVNLPVVPWLLLFSRHACQFITLSDVNFLYFVTLSTALSPYASGVLVNFLP